MDSGQERPREAGESELTRSASDLTTLGITFCDPIGSMIIHNGWATIGSLMIARPNLIEIVPRNGILASQRSRLVAVAAQVWLFGLCCLEGWQYETGTGWFVEVEMPHPGERRRAFSSARCSSDVAAPRVLAGLSRPSGM